MPMRGFNNISFDVFLNWSSSNITIYNIVFQDYEIDGVDWTKVDFEDNQECLELIEKLWLLSPLDEESNFPRATDLTLANKLRQHLQTNPYFKGDWGRGFSVCHYAGEVLYDTSGVLEKNKDPMPSDSIQLLSSCSCKLLQPFSKTLNHQSQKQSNSQHAGAFDSQKQSVSTKFKVFLSIIYVALHLHTWMVQAICIYQVSLAKDTC
ncbi:P-loop containing nucleoside triphosphate hydrolase superfamily protein [Trifolium repens]|nr:P-loop containing nucleoside triphosphate hydrolase superfamily protein [Trifolium repens]